MFSLNFWRQTIERAVKTGAQFLVAVVGAEQFNLLEADWQAMLATVGTGVALSILTSIATSGFGETDSPSAVAISSAPPEPPR
jgi:hypothetical protein